MANAGQKAISRKISKVFREKRAEGKSKKEAQKEAVGKVFGMARSGDLGAPAKRVSVGPNKRFGSTLADAIREALKDSDV